MLSLLCLLCHVGVVFGCYGGYDYYGSESWRKPTTTERVFSKSDELNRNLPEAWGGFTPPPELKKVWRKWLDDYKEARKLEALETDEKYKHERGPNSGWPPSWQGINGGFAGAEPPPWAFVPINTGLPEFCYQQPKKGSCKQSLKRWAYNPYAAECTEFTYSGCDENQNNFSSKLKCEESCMITPVSGCNPDTMQYIMGDD